MWYDSWKKNFVDDSRILKTDSMMFTKKKKQEWRISWFVEASSICRYIDQYVWRKKLVWFMWQWNTVGDDDDDQHHHHHIIISYKISEIKTSGKYSKFDNILANNLVWLWLWCVFVFFIHHHRCFLKCLCICVWCVRDYPNNSQQQHFLDIDIFVFGSYIWVYHNMQQNK